MDVTKERRLFELGEIREAVEGTEGLVWNASFLAAGKSKNGRNYPATVLERAVPLFEKAPVFVDHPSRSEEKDRPERSIRDLAGWITNPRWDESVGEEGAVIGELHLLESSPASAQIREAYERGNSDLVQLSIYGRVRAVPVRENGDGYWDVKEITKIRSVDLVTLGAAGGRIMDVMHSIREEDEMDMLSEMTLEEILEARPDLREQLQEQFGAENEDEDAIEAIQKAIANAVNTVLGKVGKVEKLSDAAKKAVNLARLAVGRGDSDAALKELRVIAGDKSVPEDLQKEVRALMAKMGYGYSKPAETEEAKEETVEDEGADSGDDAQESVLESVRSEVEDLRRTIQIAECTRKLNERVRESALPKVMQNKLIARFSGTVFEDKELEDALKEEADIYAAIVESQPRHTVRVSRDERDKMADLVTATILGEKYGDMEPLQSIQRAYCLFNGIDAYEAGSSRVASRLIRESIGFDQDVGVAEAVSWTNVFGTAMNRALAKDYKMPVFNEWELIVSDIRPLRDVKTQYIERIGYYGELPTVEAGAPYNFASTPGEKQSTFTPVKKGLLEEWTWEQALNDDLGALRKIPKMLTLAAKITLFKFVFDLIDDNTTCTYDSTALFHADHNNVSTNTLTSDNLTTAKIAMRRQYPLGTEDLRLATKPKYILVPTTLEPVALQLINSSNEVTSDKDSTVYNPHKGTLTPIVVDHWSNQTRWYLVADPNIMPTIEMGFLDGKRVPTIFTEAVNSGSAFSADKVVIKIRFVFGGAVVDHRGFYGGRPS